MSDPFIADYTHMVWCFYLIVEGSTFACNCLNSLHLNVFVEKKLPIMGPTVKKNCILVNLSYTQYMYFLMKCTESPSLTVEVSTKSNYKLIFCGQ